MKLRYKLRQYYCYVCGLLQGDESEPQTPSRPCPTCEK